MIYKLLFLSLFYFYSFYTFCEDACSDIFYSRLHYENEAVRKTKDTKNMLPLFNDLSADKALEKQWNEPPENVPNLLRILFPKDVDFINHQLLHPLGPTAVKIKEQGASLMVRVHWTYDGKSFASNAAVSNRALLRNYNNGMKTDTAFYLAGETGKPVIIYFHGGGTKFTGAHTASRLISHFSHYDIDVISIDLPWHAEGSRTFTGDTRSLMLSIGAFIQKFVHPKAHVYISGHSWGGALAEHGMNMTDKSRTSLLHPHLKGFIVLSPPIDAAPGKPLSQKLSSYTKRIEESRKRFSHLYPENERHIWTQMTEEGKTNPYGSLLSLISVLELNQRVPENKGEDLLPTLVVLGQRDPLVSINFEDLIRQYYPKMRNIEFHYLGRLPLESDPSKEDWTGHLLSDYISPDTGKPIHFKLILDFIAKQEGVKKLSLAPNYSSMPDFIHLIQHYANDLAFREFVGSYRYFHRQKSSNFQQIIQIRTETVQKIRTILQHYKTPAIRVKWILTQIINAKTDKEYLDLLSELQEVVLQKTFLSQLGNIYLEKLLQEFSQADSLKQAKEKAQAILDDKKIQQTFQPISDKKPTVFMKKVLNANDLLSAIEAIESAKLPEMIRLNALSEIKHLFEITDILNGVYIPSLEMFTARSSFSPDMNTRINTRLSGIKVNVEQQAILNTELQNLHSTARDLSRKIQKLLEEINHNIRLIKTIFSTAAVQPPESLKEEYQKLKNELEKLIEAETELLEKHDNLSAIIKHTNDIHSVEDLLKTFIEPVRHFAEMYSAYTTNRRHLRRHLLEAVEKGEMGEEYKQAVLVVYGTGSGGHRPLIGSQSKYILLEQTILELAKTESTIYRNTEVLMKLQTEYQELFASLLQLVKLNNKDDIISFIPGLFLVRDELLQSILTSPLTSNALAGSVTPQQRTEIITEYLLNNKKDFQWIHHQWKRLQSQMPPLLPTSGIGQSTE